jgi:hypothetical protein
LLSFQNCAPKSFSSGDTEIGKPIDPLECAPPTDCPVDPTKPFNLVNHTIRTEMNIPKEWTAPFDGEKQDFRVSLAATNNQNEIVIPNKGKVEILDAQTFNLRFTPDFGYRGTLVLWLHALGPANVTKSSVEVTLEVGNSLNFFQPALAVRGAGCVMCHADVRANIVSDMGFGNNFFFGRNINQENLSWNFGGIYGDFESLRTNDAGVKFPGNWANLKHQADKVVYVPKDAAIPVQEAKDLTGAKTLAEYLRHRFAASPNAGTRAANKVVEKSTVYIGAPSASRIRQVFNYAGAQKYKYDKDAAAGAYDLQGLQDAGAYWTVSGTLQCDGDLMIEGTLLLKNVTIRTRNGCRIYATRSVFIYGGINYEEVANSSLRNLQISSATAILMGLGDLYTGANHCEQNVAGDFKWYWKRQQAYNTEKVYYQDNIAEYDLAIRNSAYMRLAFFWPNVNTYTRDPRAPVTIGKEIYNEMQSTIGNQLDAACQVGGRAVSYSRLLLNAPRVESRYNGNFTGSIVAEVSLMALGQFSFQFDDVFKQVPILPKLSDSDYLKIQ